MNPVAPGPVACFQFKSVISGKPRARPHTDAAMPKPVSKIGRRRVNAIRILLNWLNS